MDIRNFTPHAVRLEIGRGTVVVFESEGIARVSTSEEICGGIALAAEAYGVEDREVLDITLFEQVHGAPEGLPPERAGVYLIVSGLVRCALPHRKDLLSPGDLIRDERGRVTGCRKLIANS